MQDSRTFGCGSFYALLRAVFVILSEGEAVVERSFVKRICTPLRMTAERDGGRRPEAPRTDGKARTAGTPHPSRRLRETRRDTFPSRGRQRVAEGVDPYVVIRILARDDGRWEEGRVGSDPLIAPQTTRYRVYIGCVVAPTGKRKRRAMPVAAVFMKFPVI